MMYLLQCLAIRYYKGCLSYKGECIVNCVIRKKHCYLQTYVPFDGYFIISYITTLDPYRPYP